MKRNDWFKVDVDGLAQLQAGDPTKRGRFNLGEKQAIAQATFAKIETTKGSVTFDRDGQRRKGRSTRTAGSRVTLEFKCNKDERADGHHTEAGYLDALTRIGAELVTIALNEPTFFKP